MDLVLDPSVLREFFDHPDGPTAQALAKGRAGKARFWIYVGDLPGLGQTADLSENLAAVGEFQWLAALATDGAALVEDSTGRTARLQASKRLGAEARLLTAEASPVDPVELKLRDFLEAPSKEPKVDFINLQTQLDRIRPGVEREVFQVIHHGRYILGPEVASVEKRLAEFTGVPHCISVASGTDSLLIALMALGVGPGDEVITVPYTWISTAEMIALIGAKPVFIDVEAETFNMDATQLEGAITERTKAIMPVCIYGQCPDMDRINEIAERHDLPVIEDAAQSYGARYKGRVSGGLSTIGSTSFFPSKPLGCYGDGGALFCHDDDLASRMRQIRVHGQAKKHHHPIIGVNGRFDTLQAGILNVKMDVFPQEVELREQVGARYASLLKEAGLTEHIRPPVVPDDRTSVFAQYTILAEDRESLRQALLDQGVPSVAYYTSPLHLQEAFANLGHQAGDFPVCEDIARRSLSLPMSPYLEETDQRRVVDALATVFQTA